MRKLARRRVLLGSLGILSVLAFWEGAAYWLAARNKFGDTLLPTIQHVLAKSIPAMGQFGNGKTTYASGLAVLAEHSAYTVSRLLAGTLLGVLVGVGLGLLISSSRLARAILEPPVHVIRNIPLLALIPLFVLWFATAERGKIIYVAFGIGALIVVNTTQAVGNVAPIYHQYARTLGASRAATYRTVVLPAILPELLAGVKVALGVSWAVVLAAEFLAAQKGLGKLLILSQEFFDVGRMIVIVLVFIVLGLLLNAAFDALTRFVCRWHTGRAS